MRFRWFFLLVVAIATIVGPSPAFDLRVAHAQSDSRACHGNCFTQLEACEARCRPLGGYTSEGIRCYAACNRESRACHQACGSTFNGAPAH
jgi:hypothetical protein